MAAQLPAVGLGWQRGASPLHSDQAQESRRSLVIVNTQLAFISQLRPKSKKIKNARSQYVMTKWSDGRYVVGLLLLGARAWARNRWIADQRCDRGSF